ncbi:MAG: hypothetical protein K2L10_10730 [Ruminococcus sp.]|nr:hypothetical protein [Ruminococcus sp.]
MKIIKIFLVMIFTVFSVTVSGAGYSGSTVIQDYQTGEFSHCTELRTVAENENYKLLVYDETAIFGLQDKKDGYIWWSSPDEDFSKTELSPVAVENLKSSAVLRYGETEKRTDNNYLRSGSPACTTGVTDIENGIRIDYDYGSYGFHFYIDYTLEKDHMKASLKTSEIVEKNRTDVATEITVLGGFGASDSTEDGYFIIPDGSGALINFNNGKYGSTYRRKIYGDDLTAVPEKKTSVTEQIYFPVYAIVRENNAMLAIASKGDSNAFINAEVSEQSGGYNTCNFSFVLRNTDTYYMSGNTTERLTVFENGGIDSGDIEILYYPISEKNLSYVDVAEIYRKYLTDKCNLKPVTKENYSPLYINFYGGTEKKKSFFGIPVMKKQSITGYSEAENILKNINAENVVVSYCNWTDKSIKNKTDTTAKPSSVLGGKKDFRKLRDYIKNNNYEFYPITENIEYYSAFGNISGAVRVSGVYAKIPDYDIVYGTPDGYRKKRYLLSPEDFGKVIGKLSKNYSGADFRGISFGKTTSVLYGDYGKNKTTRFRAMENIVKSLSETDVDILADGANAYSLPYVKHIINVPLNSSRYDIFDSDVPFFQIVIHGLIPYTSTAVNSSTDIDYMLMMSAVTGSNLYYELISGDTDTIKDTEYSSLYYANAGYWTETIKEHYDKISPLLRSVSNATISDYRVEDSGNIVTAEYSDGTVIKADFTEKTITFNNEIIKLR